MTQQQFKVNLKLKLIKASFLLNIGDDFADPSKQAFKKPTKDSTPSRFTICTISSEFNFMIFIYVVVQFYPWFNFNFPLFLGMVMYGNETKDKIEPQHQNDVGKLGRGWCRKVSSIIILKLLPYPPLPSFFLNSHIFMYSKTGGVF